MTGHGEFDEDLQGLARSVPEPAPEMPLRDFMPLPHQCRCVVFTKDEHGQQVDETQQNRCAALVYEGPDVPLCDHCQAQHWFPGSEKVLPLGRRLEGLP